MKERAKEDAVFSGQEKKAGGGDGEKKTRRKPKEYVRVVKEAGRDRGEIRTMRL